MNRRSLCLPCFYAVAITLLCALALSWLVRIDRPAFGSIPSSVLAANELTLAESLAFSKGSISVTVSANKQVNVAGVNYTHRTMSVPTTAGGTALDLGSIGTLGYCWFRNNDPSNTITLLTAVSGTNAIQLLAGDIDIFRFASTVTAPAAIAATSASPLEYICVEN